MARSAVALLGVLLVAACGDPSPPAPALPATPGPAIASSGPPAVAPAQPGGTPMTAPVVDPPLAIPAGAIYVCVVDTAGERRVTAIGLPAKVAALCARNPEMGPCQYERGACRSAGGRVFAADGAEITRATEAEYDRRVLRVRIRSN